MRWFVIEHPTRGTFVDGDLGWGKDPYRVHFSPTKPRDECFLFGSEEGAKREMRKWPKKVAERCTIVEVKLRRHS